MRCAVTVWEKLVPVPSNSMCMWRTETPSMSDINAGERLTCDRWRVIKRRASDSRATRNARAPRRLPAAIMPRSISASSSSTLASDADLTVSPSCIASLKSAKLASTRGAHPRSPDVFLTTSWQIKLGAGVLWIRRSKPSAAGSEPPAADSRSQSSAGLPCIAEDTFGCVRAGDIGELAFPRCGSACPETGSGCSEGFLKFGVFGHHKRSFQPFPADADPWYGSRGPAHLTDAVRRREPSD